MRKPTWTDEKIKKGFDIFLAEQGRLPTAHEVDALPYLPSSRAIQKRFGGLITLREQLGYTDTHFGTGEHRSAIAHTVGIRGRELEIEFEQELIAIFGERSVHAEKIFHGKQRVDFYIFTPSGNFGIDIFFPSTVRTMQNNVNIKMKKYQHFTEPLYLVVANEELTQEALDHYTSNKRDPFPENVQLLSYKQFMKLLPQFESYED
jgi:hypothetical protein